MRYLITLLSALSFSSAFALPPMITGLYLGMNAEGSYGGEYQIVANRRPLDITFPSSNPYILQTNQTTTNSPGWATNGGGGGGGAQLGYRFPCFRLEAQILYNVNFIKELEFVDPRSSQHIFFKNYSNLPNYTAQNNSHEIIGFLNFYYDIRTSASSENNVFPYIGLGIGYAQFTNITNYKIPTIYQNTTVIMPQYPMWDTGNPNFPGGRYQTLKTTRTANSLAGQLIGGFALSMDSYMDFYIDLRYITIPRLPWPFATDPNGKQVYNSVKIPTINFGVNYLIDANEAA